jgi:hypothetical protein
MSPEDIPPLETALGQVYGVGNYRKVETETKKNTCMTMEKRKERYNGVLTLSGFIV